MADERLLTIDTLEAADALAAVPPGHVVAAVVTPEGVAWVGLASSVAVEAHDGQVAFLDGHAPFVGGLGTGELRVVPQSGEARRWFVDGGVVHVADDRVMVLAEAVLPVEQIDLAAARADLEKASAEVPTTDGATAARDHLLASARVRIRLAGGAAD
jgi:F-type H+-transporting ATPase subunit epsilon